MLKKMRLLGVLILLALIVSQLPILTASAQEDDGCVNKHMIYDGDTLLNIAQRYNVDANELAALNDIENPRLIYIGDIMCLDGLVEAQPAPDGEPQPDPIEESDDDDDDGTVEGEDDDDDGQDEGPVDDGVEFWAGGPGYGYSPSYYEPNASFEIVVDGRTYRTDNLGYYTIQPGDNLYRISLAFGINMDFLAAVNGIDSKNVIFYDYRIFIPLPVSTPVTMQGFEGFPEVAVVPGQAGPGDTVSFVGYNFPPEANLEIYFEKQSQNRMSDLIMETTTDENGYFEVEVEVISEWTNGDPLNQRTVSISAYVTDEGYTDFWAMNYFINTSFGK